MAKKIIISFDSLPILGTAFAYDILINGTKIIYNTGFDTLDLFFKSQLTPAVPPNSIQLRNEIEECVNETIYTLTTYYSNPIIVYNVIGTTIEVSVNSDENITIVFNGSNPSITLSQEIIVSSSKLKYYLEYKNIVGDLYRCQISQKNFNGKEKQIFGSINIDKSNAKDHLEPIRGTGLSLSLQASKELTLDDLYTEDEQEFTVKLYVNNKIYFVGYLKPDGVYQDFVKNEWFINLDCIDGLGALKNLSFVKENGLRFSGKMLVSDIIYNCLKRTGILLNINTSVNILYDGLTASDNLDVFKKIYFNTNRFFKEDDQTIMSCEEVLKSILDVFCAVITQKNGEWYIYKPNELFINSRPLFRRYNLENEFIGTKNVNLNSVLGSQINNFYPHHAGANQRIEIKGGVSAFRISYKYGFVNGLLPNGALIKTGSSYEFWTKNPLASSLFINDPLRFSGITVKSQKLTAPTNILLITSTAIAVDKDYLFDFKASLSITGSIVVFAFKVIVNGYYLDNNGNWSNNSNTFVAKAVGSDSVADLFNPSSLDFKLSSSPTPIAGDLIVQIYRPICLKSFSLKVVPLPNATINNLDITSNSVDITSKLGEFHTVQRKQKISSIIKDNKTVFNGDEINNFYIGSIFKENKIDLTSLWYRKGVVESLTILRISAEEELRISQKPLRVFSGDVYGYLDYITICDIVGLNSKFMPIEWSYDTVKNITKIKFLELFVAEIGDIDYKLTYDFGNTVKPTING